MFDTSGLVLLLTLSFVLCATLLTTTRFGVYHDDSIYVVTAKSLATSGDYRIISLPYQPAQTKYPPLYPFLLSMIWRVYPSFPQNLNYMYMLSMIATTGFLTLTWLYLRNNKYIS